QLLYLERNQDYRLFDGSYTEFWELRQSERQAAAEAARLQAQEERRARAEAEAAARQEEKKPARKNKQKLRAPEAIEADIATAEAALHEVSDRMGTSEVASNPELLAECQSQYEALNARIEALYAEWETVLVAE
ncbi:MAG TPA: ABC transporter C-terminal domain-containing protein, partial [Acidobacteriota bacterium]|nr:ABC transporter C-terminal domain-containing protein [Acidobacteriota bacterium]